MPVLRLSPLDDRYEKQLLAEFSDLSRAMVVAEEADAEPGAAPDRGGI